MWGFGGQTRWGRRGIIDKKVCLIKGRGKGYVWYETGQESGPLSRFLLTSPTFLPVVFIFISVQKKINVKTECPLDWSQEYLLTGPQIIQNQSFSGANLKWQACVFLSDKTGSVVLLLRPWLHTHTILQSINSPRLAKMQRYIYFCPKYLFFVYSVDLNFEKSKFM